jgi:hypothetical protein
MYSTAQHYSGANQTRNSVCKNPSAYAHDQKSGMFGVRTFRKFGFATEEVRDAAAEKQITGGYSKRKNKMCGSCYTMKSTSGSCMCE